MGKFNIFEYIGSNMKSDIKLQRLCNVNLDIDENGEPFIDISYNYGKDGENLFIGLKSGVASLKSVIDVMKSLKLPYSIPRKPIITVLYNDESKKYEIEYGKDKEQTLMASNDFFVIGYIIDPKASLSFDEKINHLYDVMVDFMDSRAFATVNGIELKNPIFEKDKFNQVRYLDDNGRKLAKQENIELINKTLKEKMGSQKTKK